MTCSGWTCSLALAGLIVFDIDSAFSGIVSRHDKSARRESERLLCASMSASPRRCAQMAHIGARKLLSAVNPRHLPESLPGTC